MTHGIDLSKHNGIVNFAMVKTSGKVDFAILRAGYGRLASQRDSMFDSYYSSAKAVGIPVGAYWYSYALSETEARLEADACVEVLKGKQYDYPIFFDVEEPKQLALGKDVVSSIISAFCSTVQNAGYWVGLYMSASPLSTLVRADVQAAYSVWVAHYGVTKPAYSGGYAMWQHSSTGTVSGITGQVDLDECYVDFPTQIKAKGLNGWKSEPTPTQPETKQVVLTIGGATYSGTLTKKE